jgi:hypothetical protein
MSSVECVFRLQANVSEKCQPYVGTVITQQIQRACNAVADHVAEVGR